MRMSRKADEMYIGIFLCLVIFAEVMYVLNGVVLIQSIQGLQKKLALL